VLTVPVDHGDIPILESLTDGVLALDGQDHVVMANSAMATMMGWDTDAGRGQPAAALFADWPEFRDLLKSGDRRTRPTDLVRHLPDGGLRHFRATASPLSLGAEEGLVLVLRDVSELKRMEWEVFQAEKMTALGRLAASVAHEVRNPLGAIGIQLQLLADDVGDLPAPQEERLARRLDIAQAEMKRLDRIVHNFLRFSRTPKLRLQPTDLNDVLRHVFELVTPEAREQGIELRLALDQGLPMLEGDENQLGQAILNMTVNAFQAIRDGGWLEGATAYDPGHRQVCLSLTDSGPGIPGEEVDRIFEFYYTTKDEGTGLGLSIAQRIAYQHGGVIEVESREGSGATFRLNLPVAPAGGNSREDR